MQHPDYSKENTVALDISPVNYAALAALAANSGGVNLQNPGALGLQGLQQQQTQLDNQQKNALQLAQLQQQGGLALGQQNLQRQELAMQDRNRQGLLAQNQGELDLKRAIMQQQGAQNADSTMLEQQKLQMLGGQHTDNVALKQQELMQEQLQREMAKLLDLKKEKLQERGAFAANALVAMKGAKTPTEAQLIKTEILKEAQSSGILTKEQAEQARKMSHSQFTNMVQYETIKLNHVAEVKSLLDANEEKKETKPGEVSFKQSPDGTIEYSSTPTTENITKSQEEFLSSKSGLEQLEPYLNPPENFFGLAAGKHTATYLRELGKSVGIGADQKDVDEMALYNKFNANAKLQIMQTAKALAGARFSDADLKMIEQIMPDVGAFKTKADYMAKADLVKKFLERSIKARQEILSTGSYKLGTKEYDEAFSAKLPEIIKEAKEPVDDPLGLR